MPLRVATFNLENLDDGPDVEPTLSDRIRIMRPQLERVRADVLCLQEVHSQRLNGAQTFGEGANAGSHYRLPSTPQVLPGNGDSQ